jgi:PAS domain S-box-containing protein
MEQQPGTTSAPLNAAAAGWFFDNSLDMFIVLDGPMIASVNPSFVRLTGWLAEEVIGHSVFDLVPEDDRDEIETAVYRDIGAGVAFEQDHDIATKSGGLLRIRAQVKAAGGGAFFAIWQDITAEHAREVEREQARRSAELLRETAGIRIWRYRPDTDQFLMDVDYSELDDETNTAHLQPARQVQGRIDREDGRAMQEAWDDTIATGRSHTVTYRLTADDDITVNQVRSTWSGARQTASGKWEVLGVTQDVTELAEARDAAVAGAEAARQATETKSQFLANMSHEIRTPMNGVLGVLHLLKSESLSDEGRKLLSEALACGSMLAELLNDVMDFSKIEAGKLELSPEPIDLSAALEGVTGLLRSQAESKGLYLRGKVAPDVGWADIDPVRLRQMLFNLIGNAVKFTAAGGVEVRMFTRGEGALRSLRVEIQDTGIGISKEAQARLFERFHQADGSTTRQFGGTGLGLAITRALATLMGGEVGLDSESGHGATFWFEICAPETCAHAAEIETDARWLDGLRVLVVEDNATNRLIVTKMLENLGASVTTANDGSLGVEAVKVCAYDLIFMDIQMPVMDGVEATGAIRALAGPVSQVPIIAMTANALSHQRTEYLAAGMNGVVPKPLSPAALLAELARLSASDDAAEDQEQAA